jgi:hypothetical protein
MSLDLSTQEYARSEKTLSLACRLSGAIAGLKSFSEFLT